MLRAGIGLDGKENIMEGQCAVEEMSRVKEISHVVEGCHMEEMAHVVERHHMEELSHIEKNLRDGSIVVDVDGVSKSFTRWQRKEGSRNFFKQEKKTVTALDKVSFCIRQGEFVAYAGPNGAGKSTTMKLLSGMLQPTGGRVSVLGMSPEKERIALMKKLGVLFGNRTELWWDHPVIQSYEWKKVVWDIPDAVYRRNLDMVTELLDIGEIRNTFARELSLGQRMRADLAMMLLHSPELILLDEPTLGLDVVAKRQMIEFLKKVNEEEGVTILVTSHDMDDLEEMAERIIMISGGKLAYDGGFDGLREVTGNLTHFTVTTDGRAPELKGCRLLGGQRGVFEFEADLARVPVKVLLERLSRTEGIRNVEIRKAPIEQVITQLYQAWKNV